jgi:NAD+ synthase
MLAIDHATTRTVLLQFIRDAVRKNGFQKAILGVSGGIDSALVLALAAEALGPANVHGLLMPYKLSASASLEHGRLICERCGVACDIIDISPSVDAYFNAHPTESRLLVGNKCARERMAVLYDFSGRLEALVAGTSNKSELLVGYSTQFGDSAAAFLPIGDLYKTQIFALAAFMGLPGEIIAKQPTADLWAGQTDEGEMGITYRVLDDILYQWVDMRRTPAEIEAAGYAKADIERIMRMVSRSQFKRTMPPVAKLHPRTVGIDFRYLRDWGK